MVLNGTLGNLWVAGSPSEMLCSGNNGVLLLQAVNIYPSVVEKDIQAATKHVASSSIPGLRHSQGFGSVKGT